MNTNTNNKQLKIIEYRSSITYNHDQKLRHINIMLLPSDIALKANLVKKNIINDFSHTVVWRESTPKPPPEFSFSNSGDMTAQVLKYAQENGIIKDTKARLSPKDMFTLLETTLDDMAKNNYTIPHFIAECSPVEKDTQVYKLDAPESIILESLKPEHRKIYTAKDNNLFKTLKDLENYIKEIDPDLKVHAQIIDKDKLLEILQDKSKEKEPEQNTNTNTNTTENTPLQIKNTGQLKALTEKYTKDQIKALMKDKMPDREQLKKIYPEQEVDEFIKFINENETENNEPKA